MSLKFLLDTNILSEPLRPSPNRNVLLQLKRFEEQIATASVVWHELTFGMHKLPRSKKRSQIEKYLNEVVEKSIQILPYEQEAATMHGIWRAKLSAKGVSLSFADGQIASIAKVNNLTLVTRNVVDFSAIPELKILNWFD
jgi:tRNA(fMet)-specific endonuclease VapC